MLNRNAADKTARTRNFIAIDLSANRFAKFFRVTNSSASTRSTALAGTIVSTQSAFVDCPFYSRFERFVKHLTLNYGGPNRLRGSLGPFPSESTRLNARFSQTQHRTQRLLLPFWQTPRLPLIESQFIQLVGLEAECLKRFALSNVFPSLHRECPSWWI